MAAGGPVPALVGASEVDLLAWLVAGEPAPFISAPKRLAESVRCECGPAIPISEVSVRDPLPAKWDILGAVNLLPG